MKHLEVEEDQGGVDHTEKQLRSEAGDRIIVSGRKVDDFEQQGVIFEVRG